MEIVARIDSGRLGKSETTPSGGLRVEGALTRTGVFTYRNPNGTLRRELRHPDEVFSPESLASLRGAPVTVLHPATPVTPDNWSTLAVGHVGDAVVAEGDRFVLAPVLVQDSKAIGGVGAKRLVEVSCGYTCRVVPEAGTYNGESYDSVQADIRYNHVALGPRGWGRAGTEVQLRIDGKDAEYGLTSEELTGGLAWGMSEVITTPAPAEVRTDALEVATLRADAAEKAKDVAEARADAAVAELATVKATLAAAQDPKAVDALVAARMAHVDAARAVLGAEWKHDGKDAAAIDAEVLEAKRTIVAAAYPALVLDGKSADYVAALFDAAKSVKADESKANGAVAEALAPVRTDAAEPVLSPLEMFMKRNREGKA